MLNVAGHRLGTMEVESALVDHPYVAEAAVVGKPHEIKGQAVAAFVTLKEGHTPSDALAAELKEHVVKKIGAIARPGSDPVLGRPAQDAVGKNHAPAAARHRGRQGPRRHHDAGRSVGRGQVEDASTRTRKARRGQRSALRCAYDSIACVDVQVAAAARGFERAPADQLRDFARGHAEHVAAPKMVSAVGSRATRSIRLRPLSFARSTAASASAST